MKRKRYFGLFVILGLFSVTFLSSCSSSTKHFYEIRDFKNERIGLIEGTSFGNAVDENQELGGDVDKKYYKTYSEAEKALRNNEISAFVVDSSKANLLKDKASSYTVYENNIGNGHIRFAFQRANEKCGVFDKEISRLLGESNYSDSLSSKWLAYPSDQGLPLPGEINPSFTGKEGTIKIGTHLVGEPNSYLIEENVAGLIPEIALQIASRLDYSIQWTSDFSSNDDLLSSLNDGKVEIAIGDFDISKKLEKEIAYTNPAFADPLFIVGNHESIMHPSDLAGKNVGTLLGMDWEDNLKKAAPTSVQQTFLNVSDVIASLLAGKTDAFLYLGTAAVTLTSTNKKIKILPEPLDDTVITTGFMCKKGDSVGERLISEFNEKLAEFISNGFYESVHKKWIHGSAEEKKMPTFDFSGENGEINVAIAAILEPACYHTEGNEIGGYETEMFYRFCEEKGYKPNLIDGEFGTMITNVQTGKASIAFSDIIRTEERKKSFLFSDETNETSIAILVSSTVEGASFSDSISSSFYNTLIKDSRYLMLLEGLGTTILITVCSALLGTLLGYGVCLLRISKNKWASIPMKVLINITQGIPILIILMLLYYVIFASVPIWSNLVAILGFGLAFACEVAEILRTGIESIDPGQEEAAMAMGFSRSRAFNGIVMPQVIKRIIPVYRGSFIQMMKSTSVVGYIAIMDLTRAADLIRSRTFEAFFPLITISIIYFALSWGFIFLLKLVERKLTEKERTRKVKGVVDHD